VNDSDEKRRLSELPSFLSASDRQSSIYPMSSPPQNLLDSQFSVNLGVVAEEDEVDEGRISMPPQEDYPNKLIPFAEVPESLRASAGTNENNTGEVLKTTRVAKVEGFLGRESLRPNPGMEGIKHSPHASPNVIKPSKGMMSSYNKSNSSGSGSTENKVQT
jgi:hypothetical protein